MAAGAAAFTAVPVVGGRSSGCLSDDVVFYYHSTNERYVGEDHESVFTPLREPFDKYVIRGKPKYLRTTFTHDMSFLMICRYQTPRNVWINSQ